MGKITDQPSATVPLAGTELLTIIQSGENRKVTADAVNFTRPPVAHRETHFSGGVDPITPADIDAADLVHGHDNSEISGLGTAALRDAGTAEGEVPILDAGGLYPALDGSQITNLGPGTTNLGLPIGEKTATSLTISSDTGSDAIILGADSMYAGLLIRDDKIKLDGVADGATANETDAYLINRANHTGTQPHSSITLSSTQRLLGRWSPGTGVAELIQIGANLSLVGGVLSGTASIVDSIDDLGDVTVSNPAGNEVLIYNSSSGQWENGPAPGGGGGTVTQVLGGAGLTGDVQTSGSLDVGAGAGVVVGGNDVSLDETWLTARYVKQVTGGNGLTGSITGGSGSLAVGAGNGILVNTASVAIDRSTTDTWYATAAQGILADTALQPTDSINDLSDVTISAPSTDQVLTWNGSAWVNQTPSGGGGNGTVTDITAGFGLSGGTITESGTIAVLAGDGISVTGNVALDTDFTDTRYYTQSAADAAFATAAQGTLADSAVQPTDSINVLVDVTITSPALDQLLTWNGSGWVNADAPAGGTGTVTQVNTGTGLSGGPITDSGTITLDTGFTDGRYLSSDISTYTQL